MKRIFALAVVGLVSTSPAFSSDAAIHLRNTESNNPILYFTPFGAPNLPVENSFVQILMLRTAIGLPAVTLTNSTGQMVFTLNEPGFFDAGLAVLPGVEENSSADFIVRAWRFGPSWESMPDTDRGQSAVFHQQVGSLALPAFL